MGVPLHRLSIDEFLAWECNQPERYEFYKGETFLMTGGTARHNRIILNLASRLGDFLDGTPCQVFAENMKVQVRDGILYPDVSVTCAKSDAGTELLVVDPKLIIEVLSPSTGGKDRRDKFALYRSIQSLKEYVLIDPATRRVEVFTAADAGAWMLTDQTHDDLLRLASIDFELPMTAVFKGLAVDVVATS